jgi:methylmalonyl-CoA epimerase
MESRVDHLAIAVRSVESALAFYRDQLGMQVTQRRTIAEEGVGVTMLDGGSVRIDLLEALGSESVIARFLDKRGEGVHHVAMTVQDLSETVERLRAAGVKILNDPRPGGDGRLSAFVHPASAGGVLLELLQQET